MIGGELTITGDGFVLLVIVSALFGLWVGWMGGKAEGRSRERMRNAGAVGCLQAELDIQRRQRKLAESHYTACIAEMRLSTRVINMQLQTIKELEAQIPAYSSPPQPGFDVPVQMTGGE